MKCGDDRCSASERHRTTRRATLKKLGAGVGVLGSGSALTLQGADTAVAGHDSGSYEWHDEMRTTYDNCADVGSYDPAQLIDNRFGTGYYGQDGDWHYFGSSTNANYYEVDESYKYCGSGDVTAGDLSALKIIQDMTLRVDLNYAEGNTKLVNYADLTHAGDLDYSEWEQWVYDYNGSTSDLSDVEAQFEANDFTDASFPWWVDAVAMGAGLFLGGLTSSAAVKLAGLVVDGILLADAMSTESCSGANLVTEDADHFEWHWDWCSEIPLANHGAKIGVYMDYANQPWDVELEIDQQYSVQSSAQDDADYNAHWFIQIPADGSDPYISDKWTYS